MPDGIAFSRPNSFTRRASRQGSLATEAEDNTKMPIVVASHRTPPNLTIIAIASNSFSTLALKSASIGSFR
jgi:hypothetical protein